MGERRREIKSGMEGGITTDPAEIFLWKEAYDSVYVAVWIAP